MTGNRYAAMASALMRRLLRRRAGASTVRAMSDDASWLMMARALARETSYGDRARMAELCATDSDRERVRRGLERITAVSREVAATYERQAAWNALVRRIEETEARTPRVRPLFIGAAGTAQRTAHRTSRTRRQR